MNQGLPCPNKGFCKNKALRREIFFSRCGVLLSVGTAVLAWLQGIFTLCNSECSKNASKNHLEKEKRKH